MYSKFVGVYWSVVYIYDNQLHHRRISKQWRRIDLASLIHLWTLKVYIYISIHNLYSRTKSYIYQEIPIVAIEYPYVYSCTIAFNLVFMHGSIKTGHQNIYNIVGMNYVTKVSQRSGQKAKRICAYLHWDFGYSGNLHRYHETNNALPVWICWEFCTIECRINVFRTEEPSIPTGTETVLNI
jgi:hypothetical protein